MDEPFVIFVISGLLHSFLKIDSRRYQHILIAQPKHVLWVLKRTVSMRWFFRVPKPYVKTDELENNFDFMLK